MIPFICDEMDKVILLCEINIRT